MHDLIDLFAGRGTDDTVEPIEPIEPVDPIDLDRGPPAGGMTLRDLVRDPIDVPYVVERPTSRLDSPHT